jgi:uncharacterized C2H2 Zn-finger protein
MRYAHPPDEVDDGFKVNIETNNFHCPYCNQEFYRKLSLILHINKHHKVKLTQTKRRKNLDLR